MFLASSLVHHCLSVFRDPNTEKEMAQMNKTEIQWSIYTNIGNKVERLNYLIYVKDLMQTILSCVAEVKVLSDGDYRNPRRPILQKDK